MADDIAALGIRIDTGDVSKAVDELDRLPTAGERATRAVKNLSEIAKEFAIGFGQGARQGWREYFDGANRSEQASKKAEKGIRDVTRAVKDQEGVLRELGGSIKNLVAGYVSFQAVSSVIRSVIQNTVQAEQEQAQLAAVLRSTGESAGFSQERLNDMADALAKTSTFSAGAITSAQTRLLAYTGVVGKTFPEALQATIDMSARMGMSLEQSAETIGRALDVPSQGLTALQRQGFRFTEEQKKVVEQLERTGKVAQAQGIVLEALKSSYGGAAAAAKDTFGGSIAALRTALQDLTTGKGGSFDGARTALNELTDTLSSQETKRAFESLISLISRTIEVMVTAGTNFFNFGNFVGDTLARFVGGAADPIDRIDEKVADLRENITSLENTLSGRKRVGLPLSAEEVANVTQQLGAAKKEVNDLLGLRGDLVRQANGGGGVTNPFAPDKTVKPPKPPGIPDKEAKQISAANLAADLAEYQRQLKSYVGAYSLAERQVDAARSASLLSEQEYFDAKASLVRLNEEAQVRALNQEKSRLQQQKLSGADLIKQQTRIKDIEAEIAGIRADSASQVELLGMQQSTAMRNVTRAYEDASAAAKDYLDTIARQNQREIDGMGLGNRQREMDSRRNQREDQFLSRRNQLDGQLRANEITREQYDVYLQIERDAHQKALAEDDRYWAAKLRRQQDWSLGASEAIQNYLDEAGDVYTQTEKIFTNAMQGMEEALVQFVRTGKLDFKSLIDSITADITRMIVKQQLSNAIGIGGGAGSSSGGGNWLKTLANMGMSYLTGGASGGFGTGNAFGNMDIGMFLAKGGVVDSPGLSAYSGSIVSKPTVFPFAKGIGLMGEAGPEAVLPLKRGSDGKLGVVAGSGQGGMTVNVNFSSQGPVDRRTEAQVAQAATRGVQRAQRWM